MSTMPNLDQAPNLSASLQAPVNVKPNKSHRQQMQVLQAHGCLVLDEKLCTERLANLNYYRLSPYFQAFKLPNGKFRPGVTFEQIYQVYEFDRLLRQIIYGVLEPIEISLRTKLAYCHTSKYGPLGYLQAQHFNLQHQHAQFLQSLQNQVHLNAKLLFVQHHLDKYGGKFPLWVMTELFSFGMLSRFYCDLLTCDQKTIAAAYHVQYRQLASWLVCLTQLRNICAHFNRLYYRTFSAVPAGINVAPAAERRLWPLLKVLRQLCPPEFLWEKEVKERLLLLLNDYKDAIDLAHLGFPPDWADEI